MNPERKLEKEIGQIVDSFIQKGIQIQDIKRYLKNNPKYVENKLQLLEDDFKDIACFRESIKKYIGIILRDREYSIKDNMVKKSKSPLKQFEDDFIGEEYNYKEQKFEIGDKVIIKVNVLEIDSSIRRIIENTKEKTGKIVSFIVSFSRKIYLVRFDNPAIVIRNIDGKKIYIKTLGFYERDIKLYLEPDYDSQFEDDFVDEKMSIILKLG